MVHEDKSVDVEYWIIGAVIGPVVFVALLFVLFLWRWKHGGPTKKVSPQLPVRDVEMVKQPTVRVDIGGLFYGDFLVIWKDMTVVKIPRLLLNVDHQFCYLLDDPPSGSLSPT